MSLTVKIPLLFTFGCSGRGQTAQGELLVDERTPIAPIAIGPNDHLYTLTDRGPEHGFWVSERVY